jgi:hypothetical protein
LLHCSWLRADLRLSNSYLIDSEALGHSQAVDRIEYSDEMVCAAHQDAQLADQCKKRRRDDRLSEHRANLQRYREMEHQGWAGIDEGYPLVMLSLPLALLLVDWMLAWLERNAKKWKSEPPTNPRAG